MENKKDEQRSAHCLNCGTELKGNFCHECGQEVYASDDSVKGFMQQYFDNAYMLHTSVLTTIWLLISKPGYLTNRFLSGKFISHAHPIKLNMFLLFVFITIFVLFHGLDNLNSSVYNLTREDGVFAVLQMGFLSKEQEYVEKMKASARDTVVLSAPLKLAADYPELMALVEVKEDGKGESDDKWVGSVPKVLIEDKILVLDQSGCYCFNEDAEMKTDDIDITDAVWSSMVNIITSYLSVIILFTTPLLAFSLRLVQRRHKVPYLHHLIFSLHYTAFVELLVLFIFLLHIIVSPSMSVMKWVFGLISIIYLILAFRKVYGEKSWLKTVIKSVFTSLIYQLICLVLLAFVFLVACFVVAFQYH